MKKQKSFTLIELLVVIAIIGLLSSVVLVSVSTARNKARIASGTSFMSSLDHSLMPIGVWHLDDEVNAVDSPIADSSGYGNHGLLKSNTNCVGNTGIQNGACLFSKATNDYIEIPDSDLLDLTDQITISAWFKASALIDMDIIVHKGATYGIWRGDDLSEDFQFRFHDGIEYKICDSDFIPNIDTWYHVAASYNQNTSSCNFYVDGSLAKATNDYNQAIDQTGNNLSIGWNSVAHRFSGLIDEVRLYNEALTSSQIQKIYVQSKDKHQNLSCNLSQK